MPKIISAKTLATSVLVLGIAAAFLAFNVQKGEKAALYLESTIQEISHDFDQLKKDYTLVDSRKFLIEKINNKHYGKHISSEMIGFNRDGTEIPVKATVLKVTVHDPENADLYIFALY